MVLLAHSIDVGWRLALICDLALVLIPMGLMLFSPSYEYGVLNTLFFVPLTSEVSGGLLHNLWHALMSAQGSNLLIGINLVYITHCL